MPPASRAVGRRRAATTSALVLATLLVPNAALASTVSGAAAAIAPASSRHVSHAVTPGERVANGSFETSLTGSKGVAATLTRVKTTTAIDGAYVARVSNSTTSPYGLQLSPAPVTATGVGDSFVAKATMRAAVSRSVGTDTVSIVIREMNGTKVLATKTTSATLKFSAPVTLTVRHTALAAGSSIDVRILVKTTSSRRAFDIDGISLVATPAGATPNAAPTASFGFAPTAAVVGDTVTFTDTSRDSDGSIASRAWDLDGDGLFDDGTAASATHAFASAGAHAVALQVTDNGGLTAVARSSVNVTDVPAPPPSTDPPPAPPPASTTAHPRFNGSVDAVSTGTSVSSGGSLGPWYRANIAGAGSIRVDAGNGAPVRFAGHKTIHYVLPSAAGRAELSSVNEGSAAGQRDPATTQAEGATQYISFSLYARSAPQTGSWGWLAIQGKSIISNTNPAGLSPQISLINQGSGKGLDLRTIGGEVSSRVARSTPAISTISPGVWYDVILAAKASVTTSGWAKAWIVPQGTAIPSESNPSAQLLNAKTNYSENGSPAPIIWRQGLYHAPASSGHDLDIEMSPMARYDTFAEALSYFAR